ncbi:MAG: CoA transferase [Saprospiraceae bacterium]|nr:CoA transferase [Saprospiraceae bacterium]MDW8483250.1 CoA transferase [Saprospiraceae bacterium]
MDVLKDLLVLDCTHAVMGPTTSLLLADMGAEVIHVEPPEGDPTRRLKGFGTGYFTFFNRNKKSLAIDLKSEDGRAFFLRLARHADVVVENFGPGTMERLGLGYETLSVQNSRLIYCSLKGFMPGPYEKRHAMDEVVQMMGGLAYMTGRPGDPLRAGSSVVDITGGMFGVIGILLALLERQQTGRGKFVQASLFETTAFLMGQHMAYGAISQEPVPPMPARVSAWSIYSIFETADQERVFVGVISEKHWERLCQSFGWTDWLHDPRLSTNNQRIAEREWFLPALRERFAQFTKAQIIEKCEAAGIPFAPIARPEDLFDDPHLRQGQNLLEVRLPDGRFAPLPNLPLLYGNQRAQKRLDPPEIGEHNEEIRKRFA